MSEPIRIGLIGAGAIVQVAHLPGLKKLKSVEVAAICDVDLPKARALAERFQIKDVFDDIEDLLDHVKIDAILVATPNHLHEPHVLAGLSAGCHVLVEKPGSLTASGEQRIARLADKQGRVVMIGMTHRYRPDAQAVRSFVQSGELGELDSIRASWHVSRPARAQLGWRTRKDEAGGGAVLDLGLTMVDLCLWLAGNPTPCRVSASLSKPKGERGVEQSGSAFVLCKEGLALFVDVTWRHIGERERFGVGLRGSKGTAGINPLHVWKELNGVAQDVSPTGSLSRESAFTASFRAEWAHFLAAVSGEASVPPLSEHITLLKVIEAIYRSAADGKEVTL
ncbi:MAG TPA: Gfo/Idh/MocA family oxidoreductase [Gemmatimonadales bacterium]|jgi:predicted dehydrogenase